MSPFRQQVVHVVRVGFILLVIATLWAISAYGFADENRRHFISEMNDHNSGGALILGLVFAAAVVAAIIAALHGRRVAAVLRIAVAVLIWRLASTGSTSGEHTLAYLGVAVLYGTMTVFTVMALSSSSLAGTIWAAPLGLFTLVVMVSQFLGGPSEQKWALIGFLLGECLTICVCYPRGLVWFEGVDGT
ncbi:MAG TPA: hypothetical protein VHX44_20495 [Planctomycetota bacterium]|nr:hypothetical protein [Planctomycetota bacterium]